RGLRALRGRPRRSLRARSGRHRRGQGPLDRRVDRRGRPLGAGRHQGRLGGAAAALLSLPPLAFLGVFFVVPVSTIVLLGLRPDGDWQLGVVVDVLADPHLRGVVWFSTWQAAVSTLLTL